AGRTTSLRFFVAGEFADAFCYAAFELVARAFDLARRFGGVVLGLAFGFQVRIAGYLAHALLEVALQLIRAFAHSLPPLFRSTVCDLRQEVDRWHSLERFFAAL